MKLHGNSYQNDDVHHLYEIRDKTTQKAHKYGICGHPLKEDGTSGRAEFQASLFNQIADWDRFFVVIILTDISGRANARILEDEYIESFLNEQGKLPPGNPNHKKFKG
jgi:hypothetical protein